jgi:hypothetical protein
MLAEGTSVLVDMRTYDGSLNKRWTANRLGEDEFAAHQVRYGYPDNVISKAWQTCDGRGGRARASTRNTWTDLGK